MMNEDCESDLDMNDVIFIYILDPNILGKVYLQGIWNKIYTQCIRMKGMKDNLLFYIKSLILDIILKCLGVVKFMLYI